MRVAFDVKGTIDGPKSEMILRLFKGLQQRGHTCVVWSNCFSFAVDAIRKHDLQDTEPMDKKSKFDLKQQGEEVFDIAIEDDRRQTYLGANKFIWVDELTEEMVDELLK